MSITKQKLLYGIITVSFLILAVTPMQIKSTEFALRAGVKASRDVQTLYGGFGVNVAGLQVDYAIQEGMTSEINGDGSTHYVSLSYAY